MLPCLTAYQTVWSLHVLLPLSGFFLSLLLARCQIGGRVDFELRAKEPILRNAIQIGLPNNLPEHDAHYA